MSQVNTGNSGEMDSNDTHDALSVLSSVQIALHSVSQRETNAENHIDTSLQALSQVVKESLAEEGFRSQMAKEETTWAQINAALQVPLYHGGQEIEKCVRVKRGIILLARNLLVSDRNIPARDGKLIKEIVDFLLGIKDSGIDDSVKKGSVTASLQCIFNHTVDRTNFHQEDIQHSETFLQEYMGRLEDDDLTLYFRCVNNIFNSSESLTYGFKSDKKTNVIFFTLLEQFQAIDLQSELSPHDLLVISIFQKMIVHESFLPYITNLQNQNDFVSFLKAAGVIITSKESWETFELTVILSWMYELFQKTLRQIKSHFTESKITELEPVYSTIHAVLDVFSTLVKFDHSKKFLLSYKGVENLVELLGVIHQNVKPKKLKDSEREQKKQEERNGPGGDQKNTQEYYKNFPEIKSLIIETLSAVIYKDFAVQELMRETHGLELVLSNCIIDDNEPFIKERSIVCLRFLLLNNEKNQEFVAKLEAKEAVQDETLDNAGFEVEIVDGKVKLKQKADAENRVQTKDQNAKIHEVTE